jgi:hypothetical protein
MTLLPEETREAERAAYAAVDSALRSFPLQPAPPGLAPAVLAVLRSPERAAVARPVFRVSWIDFALSGFAAMMLALVLSLSGWLTPAAAARLQAMAAEPLLQSDVLVWGFALAGLVAMAGLMLVAGFVFRRPAGPRKILS